jgi:hypothetical protein
MIADTKVIEGTPDEVTTQLRHWPRKRVRVSLLPEIPEPQEHTESCSITEKIAAIMADVSEEDWSKLPTDLSDNLDHYIYGTPKQV